MIVKTNTSKRTSILINWVWSCENFDQLKNCTRLIDMVQSGRDKRLIANHIFFVGQKLRMVEENKFLKQATKYASKTIRG